MSTISLPRWEYAYLTIDNRATPNASNDTWTWISTATLSMRSTIIAQWRNVDRPRKPNDQEVELLIQNPWTPIGRPPKEHDLVVHGPVDHLGDLGWEAVSVTIAASAIRTGNDIGWQTTLSVPQRTFYLFKRSRQQI